MNRPQRKLLLWLGADDGEGSAGSGYDVHREDAMVSIESVADSHEELQVFILPSLFPAVRKAMKAAEQRMPKEKKKKKEKENR